MTRFLFLLLLFLSFTASPAIARTAAPTRVHFRVNESRLDSLFNGNLTVLNGLKDAVETVGKGRRIKSVSVIGSASPEGDPLLNMRLSEARAAVVAKWLADNLDCEHGNIHSEFLGSNWDALYSLALSDSDLPKRENTLKLISMKNPALFEPSVRDYLKKKFYPEIRYAEVAVEFETTGKDNTSDISEAPTVSATSSQEETYAVSGQPARSDMSEWSDLSDSTNGSGYSFVIKTNLLYDAALVPNIGLEFPLGKGFSIGADWMYAWWSNHARNRQWKTYGGDIFARYYLGRPSAGAPLSGHHFGIYGQVHVFEFAFGHTGYISGIPGQDLFGKPWFGGGLEYGYTFRLKKRLSLDLSLGIGYLGGEYRKYHLADGHYVWDGSFKKNWIGPTKAEISLGYIIGKLPRKEVSK